MARQLLALTKIDAATAQRRVRSIFENKGHFQIDSIFRDLSFLDHALLVVDPNALHIL
jgi:hypothetical protein